MRKLIIAIAIISVAYFAQAQVPGYLGKKILIGYHVDVTPIFGGDYDGTLYRSPTITYDGKAKSSTLSLFNRHNFEIEVVVGKNVSFQASVGFAKNGLFTYEREAEQNTLALDYSKLAAFFDKSPYNDTRDYDYLNVNHTLYKFGINIFDGRLLAPQGNYWNYSVLINKSYVHYIFKDVSKDLTTITNYGFSIDRGYRRIIADQFILDFGLGMGWLFGKYVEDDAELNRSDRENLMGKDVSRDLTQYSTGILNSALIFHGRIGIKYMIPVKM